MLLSNKMTVTLNSIFCKQGDNMFISKPNMPSVANSMLRQQGDNTLIKYQSCHAIVKKVDSQYK